MPVATDTGRTGAETSLEPGPTIRLFEPAGRSLEDTILALWEELVADGRADCPVCGATMRAAAGCDACGSDLS